MSTLLRAYRGCLLPLLLLIGCKTVVTSTTEVRPSRYAVTEFTRALSPDSFMVQTKRAIVAVGLKVQREDKSTPSVTAGPLRIAATDSNPALDAVVVISLEARGPQTWIRILASAVLPEGQMGGQDARLAEVVQRIRRLIETTAES